MKNPANSASASYIGHVKGGVVIFDGDVSLKDGQAVRVEPLQESVAQLERARQLQQVLAEWTDEDGKLSDEEADCLHAALERNRGLDFRSPIVD